MDKNEIKKILYKEKPIATLIQIESAGSILKIHETCGYLDNFYPIMDFYDVEESTEAIFECIRGNNVYYRINKQDEELVSIELNTNSIAKYKAETSIGEIEFLIPTTDMGTTDFSLDMEAKLLIRWIK